MANSRHYSGVVLPHKVRAGDLEGKAAEFSGAAMQREETRDQAWGSPLLSRLRSHGVESEKLPEEQEEAGKNVLP